MKKFFLAILAILSIQAATFAQTKPTVKTTKAATTTVVKDTARKSRTKPSGAVLKKDGTPDKRYKASSVPLKKDGTPDKRYNVNKDKKQ